MYPLQPLDFGCFSVLKNSYGQLVQDRTELGIFHINKTDFLTIYHQGYMTTLIEKTVKKAIEAVRIVPFNPDRVLTRFTFKTPSLLLQSQTLQPQDFGSQLPLQTP